MGLRLLEGLYIDDVSNLVDWPKFNSLLDDGLVWKVQNRIGATPEGRPVLNYLISQLAKS
jgi:oxygen-independent coproporphyrinogen-3 oxidase